MSEDPTVPDQMPGSQGLETRVGRLETSVEFVKSEISTLSHGQVEMGKNLTLQIAGLGEKLTSSGQTDWKTIAAFASTLIVITGFLWTVGKSPLESAITRNEVSIRELKADNKEGDREVAKALKEISSAIVPRGEHTRIWEESNRRFEKLEHSVEIIQHDWLSALFTRAEAARKQ